MWNDYFLQLKKKYSMRISTKTPLVINLDGKNVTKNPKINLFIKTNNGFLDAMEQTVKYFTNKYNCLSIFGTDEVSFIFTNSIELVKNLNSSLNTYSNEIAGIFSQYFFDYFNSIYDGEKVFWHVKCYSIPTNKVISYIKYKSEMIKIVLSTYLLKRRGIEDAGKLKKEDRMKKCEKYKEYSCLKKIENGILYLNGNMIDTEEFLNGNIVKIKEEKVKAEDEYFDITKWDIE